MYSLHADIRFEKITGSLRVNVMRKVSVIDTILNDSNYTCQINIRVNTYLII